jgi:DNA/RNA endonuclease YhcR with UshA esterase domain
MPRIKAATNRWLPIANIILFLPFASNAAETTVASILANPVQFDGRSVTVRGSATAVKPTVSRKGNAYTTLQLQDGGSVITVNMRGHPATKTGDRVEVTGVFQTVTHVGAYTVYKIEAQSITPTLH